MTGGAGRDRVRGALAPAAVLAALTALAPAAGGQTPFRATLELVSVYATVHDRNGRLVPGLTRDQFMVFDNGREQPITVFSNDVGPFSVVILLDRSGSMVEHQGLVREAAAAFVAELRPGDQARIGSIATRFQILPDDFTGDQDALRAILARPTGGGASPIWYAVDTAITSLYGREGRRVILLLSDGKDEPAANHPRTPFGGLLERIRRSGVMVYAIGFGTVDVRGGRNRVEPPHRDLRRLAEASGGGYFKMTDTAELTSLFQDVAEELRHQYWIGFEPPRRDGRLHEIRVRVKTPGLTVRARPSYLAPSGG